MANNGHQIKKAMVKAPPECKGQTTCLECTRPKCRYDTETRKEAQPRCVVCGKPFERTSNNQKCCSPECAEIRRQQRSCERHRKSEIAICAFCGKEFVRSRKNHLYCSPKCQRQSCYLRRKESKRAYYQRKRKTILKRQKAYNAKKRVKECQV